MSLAELARVLGEADGVFIEYDRLRLELRTLEESIQQLCRSYDDASGCRGLRPEALRRAVNEYRTARAD